MAILELETALPYMTPEYWDGNTLGVDPVSCGDFMPRDHVDFARDALKRKMAMMHGDSKPLARLTIGQVFEANEHPPGTVIRFRRETAMLYDAESRLREGLEIEPVEPLRDLSKDGIYTTTVMGEVSKYGHYISSEYWAVVAPAHKGQQGLLGLSSRYILPKLNEINEYRFLSPVTRVMPHDFEVGQVYGSPLIASSFRDRALKTRYRRVVAAEVVGWAGKKKPSKIQQVANKLGELLLPGQAPEPAPIRANR